MKNIILLGLLILFSCSKQGDAPAGCESNGSAVGDSEVNCRVTDVTIANIEVRQVPENPELIAGSISEGSLIITNKGTESVDGLAITRDNALFNLSTNCSSLSPGQSCVVDFDIVETAAKSATRTFRLRDSRNLDNVIQFKYKIIPGEVKDINEIEIEDISAREKNIKISELVDAFGNKIIEDININQQIVKVSDEKGQLRISSDSQRVMMFYSDKNCTNLIAKNKLVEQDLDGGELDVYFKLEGFEKCYNPNTKFEVVLSAPEIKLTDIVVEGNSISSDPNIFSSTEYPNVRISNELLENEITLYNDASCSPPGLIIDALNGAFSSKALDNQNSKNFSIFAKVKDIHGNVSDECKFIKQIVIDGEGPEFLSIKLLDENNTELIFPTNLRKPVSLEINKSEDTNIIKVFNSTNCSGQPIQGMESIATVLNIYPLSGVPDLIQDAGKVVRDIDLSAQSYDVIGNPSECISLGKYQFDNTDPVIEKLYTALDMELSIMPTILKSNGADNEKTKLSIDISKPITLLNIYLDKDNCEDLPDVGLQVQAGSKFNDFYEIENSKSKICVSAVDSISNKGCICKAFRLDNKAPTLVSSKESVEITIGNPSEDVTISVADFLDGDTISIYKNTCASKITDITVIENGSFPLTVDQALLGLSDEVNILYSSKDMYNNEVICNESNILLSIENDKTAPANLKMAFYDQQEEQRRVQKLSDLKNLVYFSEDDDIFSIDIYEDELCFKKLFSIKNENLSLSRGLPGVSKDILNNGLTPLNITAVNKDEFNFYAILRDASGNVNGCHLVEDQIEIDQPLIIKIDTEAPDLIAELSNGSQDPQEKTILKTEEPRPEYISNFLAFDVKMIVKNPEESNALSYLKKFYLTFENEACSEETLILNVDQGETQFTIPDKFIGETFQLRSDAIDESGNESLCTLNATYTHDTGGSLLAENKTNSLVSEEGLEISPPIINTRDPISPSINIGNLTERVNNINVYYNNVCSQEPSKIIKNNGTEIISIVLDDIAQVSDAKTRTEVYYNLEDFFGNKGDCLLALDYTFDGVEFILENLAGVIKQIKSDGTNIKPFGDEAETLAGYYLTNTQNLSVIVLSNELESIKFSLASDCSDSEERLAGEEYAINGINETEYSIYGILIDSNRFESECNLIAKVFNSDKPSEEVVDVSIDTVSNGSIIVKIDKLHEVVGTASSSLVNFIKSIKFYSDELCLEEVASSNYNEENPTYDTERSFAVPYRENFRNKYSIRTENRVGQLGECKQNVLEYLNDSLLGIAKIADFTGLIQSNYREVYGASDPVVSLNIVLELPSNVGLLLPIEESISYTIKGAGPDIIGTATGSYIDGIKPIFDIGNVTVTLTENVLSTLTIEYQDDFNNQNQAELISIIYDKSAPNPITFVNPSEPLTPQISVISASRLRTIEVSIPDLLIEEQTIHTLYSNEACSDTLAETNRTSESIINLLDSKLTYNVDVPLNDKLKIYSKTFDEFGNETDCLFLVEYEHDGIPPSIGDVALTSLPEFGIEQFNNIPKFTISSTEEKVIFDVYGDSICSAGKRFFTTSTPGTFDIAELAVDTYDIYMILEDEYGNKTGCIPFNQQYIVKEFVCGDFERKGNFECIKIEPDLVADTQNNLTIDMETSFLREVGGNLFFEAKNEDERTRVYRVNTEDTVTMYRTNNSVNLASSDAETIGNSFFNVGNDAYFIANSDVNETRWFRINGDGVLRQITEESKSTPNIFHYSKNERAGFNLGGKPYFYNVDEDFLPRELTAEEEILVALGLDVFVENVETQVNTGFLSLDESDNLIMKTPLDSNEFDRYQNYNINLGIFELNDNPISALVKEDLVLYMSRTSSNFNNVNRINSDGSKEVVFGTPSSSLFMKDCGQFALIGDPNAVGAFKHYNYDTKVVSSITVPVFLVGSGLRSSNVAVDSSGNCYYSLKESTSFGGLGEQGHHRLYKISPSGVNEVFAESGRHVAAADNESPFGIPYFGGNIFIHGDYIYYNSRFIDSGFGESSGSNLRMVKLNLNTKAIERVLLPGDNGTRDVFISVHSNKFTFGEYSYTRMIYQNEGSDPVDGIYVLNKSGNITTVIQKSISISNLTTDLNEIKAGEFTEHKGYIYFISRKDVSKRTKLYRMDPNGSNLELVYNVNPEGADNISNLTKFNDNIYFLGARIKENPSARKVLKLDSFRNQQNPRVP
jgi:hypothetical protein